MEEDIGDSIESVEDMRREFRDLADDLEADAPDLSVILRSIADDAEFEDGEFVGEHSITLPFRDDDDELTFIVGMAVGAGMAEAEYAEQTSENDHVSAAQAANEDRDPVR